MFGMFLSKLRIIFLLLYNFIEYYCIFTWIYFLIGYVPIYCIENDD